MLACDIRTTSMDSRLLPWCCSGPHWGSGVRCAAVYCHAAHMFKLLPYNAGDDRMEARPSLLALTPVVRCVPVPMQVVTW